MRSFYRTDSSTNPLGALSSALAVRAGRLEGAAKAANEARMAARSAALAERGELERQLLDTERQLRNINPLPAPHPARALEAGLLEQAESLRAQILAVEVPPHPNAAEIGAVLASMWR
jgi:hypothetical protein